MPFTGPGEVSFEKSPSYFPMEAVPARIKSVAPDTKFVLAVKDPIPR